jgi:hypothetical protein
MVLEDFSVNPWKERKAFPGRATYSKPSESRADKFSAK